MAQGREDVRLCEVCGKRLHRLQTCPECGKAFCNRHLSPTRHECRAAQEKGPKGATVGRDHKAASKRLLVILAVVVGVAIISLSAAVLLIGGDGQDEENRTEVTAGTAFSLELSFQRIQEAMVETRGTGRRFPGGEFPEGGFPGSPFGNGTFPFPFGNETQRRDFMNRTRLPASGFLLNMTGAEFLVAIPEPIDVRDSTSVQIREIESHDGYAIYGVSAANQALEGIIELDLEAPTSHGEYRVYYTLTALSGLEQETAVGTMGAVGVYTIGELTFMVRETFEVK